MVGARGGTPGGREWAILPMAAPAEGCSVEGAGAAAPAKEPSAMRVLFTLMASTGHLHPLVPVARALAAAGHSVAVATHPVLAPQVAGAGFRHLPAGLYRGSPEVAALWAAGAGLAGEARVRFLLGRDFAGLRAAAMAADLRRVLAAWPADLLVRENTEFAACVVAEAAGLPHAAVSTTAAGFDPRWLPVVGGPLDALRAAHGLPPDPAQRMLSRHLTLHPFPPRFMGVPLGPTDVAVRPEPFDRSGPETLPAWVDALPARPTVYATLGTVTNGRTDLLAAFLAGVRDEPVNLILTVGRDGDPARLGPQPPHVRVARYVPQSLLMPRCAAVLTHGGSGTVAAALAAGLPQVVVPVGADQPRNAARCAALGLGRVVAPPAPGDAAGAVALAGAVRDAVRDVLTDGRYRRNAERLRDELRALPGPETAVGLLERLAAGRPAGAGRAA
jgi:UDP:flavonoid glycosyltransferase YjiC (YdhE family)